MNRKSEESESGEESNSAEKMSTTDEVGSHNWSDEDESKDELDLKTNGDAEESETDSRSESEADTDQDRLSPNATNNGHHRTHKKGHRRRAGKRKRLHQSDTETRKLLDDIGDDDDYAYLDEAKENTQIGYDMSEEQIDYYSKCFLHLQRKTQGYASLSGAVSGADDRVVEFFRKSQLDTRTLSRVWSLADINEDGYLNHTEFMLAMHLIVLNVKGNVPVPSRLPSPIRPCITPTRLLQPLTNELQNSTASSASSNMTDNASTSRGSESQTLNQQASAQHFHHFQSGQMLGSQVQPTAHLLQATTSYADDASPKHHSLSDDHLHVHAQKALIANFSNAPPVLVDNRPTALNTAPNSAGFALLNSLASRGPPPKIPQRQYNTNEAAKGHGRSASLDLNTLAGIAGQLQKPNASMFQSTTSSAGYHPTTMSVDESVSASAFTSNSAHFFASPTPPIPPPLRQQQYAKIELQSRATQTEDEAKTTLDEQTFTALLEDSKKMTPTERCRVLRLYNAELESERAMLAQIRLQLQLRLDEAEQALKNHGVCVQPLAISPTEQQATSVASPKPTTV